MIRNLKTLGVALCAVLALTAVAASAASAANFTASSYPTTATGVSELGNDVFKTEAGNVECKAHFSATLSASSSTLTATPTYTNCKAFGFLEATVSMGSCDYLFDAPSLTSTHLYTGVVTVKCTNAASPIVIKAGTCKATVGEQSPGGHVIFEDTTVPGRVHEIATVTEIKYTVTEDGFACPFGGTGAKTGATYTQGKKVELASTNGASIDVG